ncbi:epoxyqueuosine reductase QueH [bacterium]
MEKILIHTCCAPCLVYVQQELRNKFEINCYFYNPNIHPYKEFAKRKQALEKYVELENIFLISGDYKIDQWFDFLIKDKNSFKQLITDRKNRCMSCYKMRLRETAEKAKALGINIISTTLLYSLYQYHDLIKNIGQDIAKEFGLEFYYQDFREGWQKGFEIYNKTGLYKQNYCACIFSEQERFNSFQK